MILELMPKDTPDYMTAAWIDCIRWAIGQDDILAAFRADTGNMWEPGTSGLERMVDKTTGADRDFIVAFVKWVNVNVWGSMDGPDDEGGEE